MTYLLNTDIKANERRIKDAKPQMKKLLQARPVRATVSIAMIVTFLFSCAEGISKKTWSRKNLEVWYAEHRPQNSRIEFVGYLGSDAEYHYYIMRPMDSFFIPRVSKSELTIADERPYSGAASGTYGHYAVDVLHGFRKVMAHPLKASRDVKQAHFRDGL